MATEKTKTATERTFADRLSAVLEDVGMVGKDGHNAFHRYDYTSAAAVQRSVQRALSKHGLYIESDSMIVAEEEYETKNKAIGKRITMRTKITASDGHTHASGTGFGCGQDTEDKAPMKAQTASYKYALCALFCIGMGDDPEVHDEKTTPAEGKAGAPKAKPKAKPKGADAVTLDPNTQEVADLLKTVKTEEELRVWFQFHWDTIAALPNPHKKVVWSGVLAIAETLAIPKEKILSLLPSTGKSEKKDEVEK